MQTHAWTLHAMALEMPAVADHPNRHPFKGVLTKLDQPSTRPPEGSGNRRVILPREVAQSALSSILGMAVDYQNAVGHDPQKKIGVITAAHIVGDDVTVEGFFYAKDFPAEVAEIRALGARMGMSYELADVRVESLDAPILTIASCVFTGAAILLRDKAAYHATSLAAAAEQEENPMEELIKQLMAQSTSQTEVLGKLLEAQTATNTLLAAANVAKEEQDDTDGDSADSGAKPGKRDEVKAKAKKGAKAPDEEADDMDAGADAVTTQLAAMAAEIATLKAAAAKPPIVPPGEPDRKTLSGDVLTLLAKAGVGSSVNDEGKLSAAALDEALSKTAMNVTERLAFKTSLRKAGALEVQ